MTRGRVRQYWTIFYGITDFAKNALHCTGYFQPQLLMFHCQSVQPSRLTLKRDPPSINTTYLQRSILLLASFLARESLELAALKP